MAYYSKVNTNTTRDQKRRQAEKRGGFDDEGSHYSSDQKPERTDNRTGNRGDQPKTWNGQPKTWHGPSKPQNGQSKAYGDRPRTSNGPAKSWNGPSKSQNDQPKAYGDRPRTSNGPAKSWNGPSKSQNDQPRAYGDRPRTSNGSSKSWNGPSKLQNDQPRAYGDRPRTSNGPSKSWNGPSKSQNDQPRAYGDRPRTSNGPSKSWNGPSKSQNDQPRAYGDRPRTWNDQPKDDTRGFKPKTEHSNGPRKFSQGKPQQNGELRFAPRGTSTYRTRGDGFTPKPYGVQRREQQADKPPAYTAYRADTLSEDTINENLLSGRNPIREALKAGRDIEKLLVARGELSGSAKEIVAMAREQHVPVQEVDRARLDAISPHHQGMLAFASAYQYHTVEDMLALAETRQEKPFLVMLDGVTDPHNLGAVIRTAECAGAHGVIVQERRAVGLTPAAVKASAGAIEHLMVSRVVNLAATLETLKKKDIWAYAADATGEDYTKIDFSGGAVIVIGAEGEGISRLLLEKCDKTVALPIRGKIGSLNASVAAGVLLYAVLRSR